MTDEEEELLWKTPPEFDAARLALVADVWKYAVGVQMHFNDMGMKIRNLYFTILAAAIGLIGAVQGKKIDNVFPSVSIHLVLVIIVTVIPISMLFYFLDRHWYHRLLMGAVIHCGRIEDRYKTVLPELRLGAAISKESPVLFDGVWPYLFWFVTEKRYRDPKVPKKPMLHSDGKLEVLYKSVIWIAVIASLAYIFLGGGIEYKGCSLLGLIFSAQCPDP